MTAVSVAMATYNGAAFLEEQLESILSQDPPPAELVVSDDGSTDNTLTIVRNAAKDHPRTTVCVLQGNRLGVSGNFERAMRATTGDIVALSDQDDRWHPGRLMVVVAEFRTDPALLFMHHDADLVDPSGLPLGRSLLRDLRVSAAERRLIASDDGFAAYVRRNLATGATVAFRRSLLAEALPVPLGWVHDEWLAIIAAACGKVRLYDSALIDYRQHGSNQIGVADPTLRYRIGRLFASRGSRYPDLAARSALLADRLAHVAADPKWRALAADKAAFEAARSAYPVARFARLPAVLRQRREYPRLSSQGSIDIVRDLVQAR